MTDKQPPIPQEWDSAALLVKAQRYAEEMISLPRDDWKYPLWASLSLELLVRATLASFHPSLLADPKDWHNLQHSLGLETTAKKFSPKSIGMTEALARLREIAADFDTELEGICALQISRRNAELHSGDNPFEGLKENDWLPGFFRSCRALLKPLGLSLADFFGSAEAEAAEKQVEAALDVAGKAVLKSVDAHKQVWLQKPEDERTALAQQAAVWAARSSGHRNKCPACDSAALIAGEPVSSPKKIYKEDTVTEIQTYLPSRFECIACGLKLTGLSQLTACGLSDTFNHKQVYDLAEYYGAVDDDAEHWEPDNNE